MILVATFLSGVVLYVIGSLMERRELAERERWWRSGRDETLDPVAATTRGTSR
jgi:hypothetical protein